MTLLEHLRELRSRLFKASLGVLAGFIVGFMVSSYVLDILERPYCKIKAPGPCNFLALGATDPFTLQVKVSLYVGLILAAPIWLYQLWAFIAPGLHKHERRWAYTFSAIAAPLFACGAVLAYFVVSKGLRFLFGFGGHNIVVQLDVTRYVSFVTNLLLLFGVAFEFPLIVVLLNLSGVASAKRLLSWWRISVFLFFAFSAITVPTPDPIGMSALGLCLTALYFAAVGFAFFNDRRRRLRHEAEFGDLDDDEISPLDTAPPIDDPDGEPIEAGSRIDTIEPVAPARALDRRYDDMT
jgi:sec-independent protein translocase protein TatC